MKLLTLALLLTTAFCNASHIQVKKIKAAEVSFKFQQINGFDICTFETDKYSIKMKESSKIACGHFQQAASQVEPDQDIIIVSDSKRKQIIHITTPNNIKEIN